MSVSQELYTVWYNGRASLRTLRFWENGRNRVVVLMYHEVQSDSEPMESWMVVRETDFIAQMEFLKRHFRTICLDDALERMKGSQQITENLALVTFDDGYAGNRNVVLPIVESMNIPVAVFVSTEAVQNQTAYWWDALTMSLRPEATVTQEIDLKSMGRRK